MTEAPEVVRGASSRAEEPAVSATIPDWSRERCERFWDPGRQLLRSIRGYQSACSRSGLRRWMRRWWLLRFRFWSVVSGGDIPLTCQLGGGLCLTHPSGVVIHPKAVVGPNCLILQHATLGLGGSKPGAPVLGGHVDVGAGAQILGGVVIGDHAKIGANAVVLHDVPAGATAVGVPARIVQRHG